jgi:hypothetical protein
MNATFLLRATLWTSAVFNHQPPQGITMMSSPDLRLPRVWRSIPRSLACAAWAAALMPIPVPAQQPPAVPNMAGVLSPEQIKQMEAAGVPMGDMMARSQRMSEPNAGKRPGDEKLDCGQIKSELVETRLKHDIQTEKQNAAKAAMEADAAKAQAENSGPGSVATGFFGGLAAISAHAIGAGDAFNEKAKADLIAKQKQRQDLQIGFSQEAEASKALSDRSQVLMKLSKAKGCKPISLTP